MLIWHEPPKEKRTIMLTFIESLTKFGIEVPAHLDAQAGVPVITGRPQRQGDLLITPYTGPAPFGDVVPLAGVQLVVGEATGNTHWLDALGAVHWHRHPEGREPSPTLGVFTVAEGAVAYIVHTDEHGANGFGPGRYEVRRALEQADRVRLVAD